jgi:hypothetical protein
MMTPVPMPLTRGCWLSSGLNGHRLEEAERFSLEMLTTVAWTFWTACTTGVRRSARPARAELIAVTTRIISKLPARGRQFPIRRSVGLSIDPSPGLGRHLAFVLQGPGQNPAPASDLHWIGFPKFAP